MGQSFQRFAQRLLTTTADLLNRMAELRIAQRGGTSSRGNARRFRADFTLQSSRRLPAKELRA